MFYLIPQTTQGDRCNYSHFLRAQKHISYLCEVPLVELGFEAIMRIMKKKMMISLQGKYFQGRVGHSYALPQAYRHWLTSHLGLCNLLFLCTLSTCTFLLFHAHAKLVAMSGTLQLLFPLHECSSASSLWLHFLWPSSIVTSLKRQFLTPCPKYFPLSPSHTLSHHSISFLLRSLHTL